MIVTLWGICAFPVCAITQAMVVTAALKAPNLASTLNISAFNLGNALAAGLSAAALSAGLSLNAIPLLAHAVAVLAAGAALVSLLLGRFGRATINGKIKALRPRQHLTSAAPKAPGLRILFLAKGLGWRAKA